MKRILSEAIHGLSLIVGFTILLSSCGTKVPEETTAPTIEPWRVCATEGAEAVLSALKTPNFDTISALSGRAYKIQHFTEPSCDNSLKLFTRTFDAMEWTVGEVTIDADSLISVEVELTYADYKAAVNAVAFDEEKMTEVFRPKVLNAIDDDQPYDTSKYVSRYIDFVLLEMDKNPKTMTTRETLVIRFNATDNSWRLIAVPDMFRDFESFLYNVDPLNIEETEELDILNNQYWIAATELLYEEGEIGFSEYYSAYWRGCMRRVMKIEEARDRLSRYVWFDFDSETDVTYYKAGDPELVLLIIFYVPQPGLMLYYEFFKVGQKTPLAEGEEIMLGQSAQYISYLPEGGLKKGNYKVIVRIEDGSILVEDTITVK